MCIVTSDRGELRSTTESDRDDEDGAPRQGEAPRQLANLLDETSVDTAGAGGVRITGVATDSRSTGPGSLFIAIRGRQADGHAFVDEAVRRGAAAVVVDEWPGGVREGVPIIEVEDTRRALARVAARYHGRPAERLSLVGITGTVGKTSVVTMLEAMLTTSGHQVGVVGSLGVRIGGKPLEDTGFTSPDALKLHEALARIEDAGCRMAAMEVTSHALVQERMHGICLELGIMTNLVPLEHADYHGTFRKYVEAKRRFLDLLGEGVPFVFNSDDRTVRRFAREGPGRPVGCGRSRQSDVRIEEVTTRVEGTRLTLNVRNPIPRVGGGEVRPTKFPLELHLLGRSNVTNAALAATAALCLGVDPEHVSNTLADFPAPKRRMQIVHRDGFLVIDDTVGHPDSISAVFEVAGEFSSRRVHVAYAVRGSRGSRINRQIAEALAIWAERLPMGTVVVTRSEEAADERNRVDDEEYDAFLGPLREHDVHFVERARVDDAVRAALDCARDGDLVLLLGAQGMDRGQAVAREWLAERDGDIAAGLRRPP